MPADEGMKKLNIPQTFTPYLEKHGIYDLFYDFSVAFALNQPEDHVIFLRNYLCKLDEINDSIRIIILGSPHIDKRGLSEEIANGLNLLVVSFKEIKDKDDSQGYTPKTCAINLKHILEENLKGKSGWILYDYPRGRDEAREMKKLGIYPSHTYQLVPSPEYFTKRDLWNETLIGKNPKELKEIIDCYKMRLVELKATYGDTIKEIVIRGRTLQQIARAIIINTKQVLSKGGPQLPRVVIIGDITDKVNNAVREICKRLKLIYINMDEVISEGTRKEDDLGKHLRILEKRQVRIYGKLVLALLQNRLMNYDCLNEGWILVGFPRDRADFEALDSFDTPPNRIIFLIPTDLDKRDCLREWVMLNPRDYGQEILDALCPESKPTAPNKPVPAKETLEKIANQLTGKQIKDFLDYCGKWCKFVNPELSIDNMIQVITKYITDSSPLAPPRLPTTKDELAEQLMQNGPAAEDVDDQSEEYCYPDERLKEEAPKIEVIKALSFESVTVEEEEKEISDSSPNKIVEIMKSSSSVITCDDRSCLDIFPWKNQYQKCDVKAEINDPFASKKKASSSSEFDLNSSSFFR